MIRAGAQLTVTGTGQQATVWSAAPGPGTYWCHVEGRIVLVEVRKKQSSSLPVITIKEEA